MNNIQKTYEKWKKLAVADPDLKIELKKIANDVEQITDRFYKNLDFGTAGIRGVVGAGTNRMNLYVVAKLTQAFSLYLNEMKMNNSVVISYDNRIKSKLFAQTAASVFAANKIKVKIFKQLKPVPMLSFSVRFLKCSGGVMITASHNSAEYNGYKLYNSCGCQLIESEAEKISKKLEQIDVFNSVKFLNFEQGLNCGLISFCNQEIEQNYLNCVKQNLIQPKILINSQINVLYTPLHGSGLQPISLLFKQLEFKNLFFVEPQCTPDENFTTCKSPNPENLEAFKIALKCVKKNTDVVIATDPDCDRIGVLVRVSNNQQNEFKLLNGNELGVLMLNYVCEQRLKLKTMPNSPIMFKTIVSTPLADKIAAYYGVEVENVLTGFKYIGHKISQLEKKGQQNRFIFAFEESQGYLAGCYVRDKDGVLATGLICEMVAFYKQNKKTLIDVLQELYLKFGFFKSSLQSYEFKGKIGLTEMLNIMKKLQQINSIKINNFKLVEKIDYLKSTKTNYLTNTTTFVNLPKSKVVEFNFQPSSKVIVRVSGTEPKIKIYYSIESKFEKNLELINQLKQHFPKLLF